MAALMKPPAKGSRPLCQPNGQYARLRKRSISTSASVEQVLSTVPSGLVTMSLLRPGSAAAEGSLEGDDCV